MKYITFAGSDRKVSTIVPGTMRIAGLSPKQFRELLAAAEECGINFLDFADIYGGGRSESLMGELLAAEPSLREKFVIQSKCAIHRQNGIGFYDFSKEYILEAVDGILQRLQTEYLDVLLLHRPDALMEPEEVAEAFDSLKRSGKVRMFGVSNMSPVQMQWLGSALSVPLVANQMQLSAAFTSMLDGNLKANTQTDAGIMRDGGTLEYCRMNDIVLQSWSSLQFGRFEGSFIGSEKYPELNAVLETLAEKYGITPAAVALAWILRIPGKFQAVIGTTSPAHLREAAAAADVALSREEWYRIYLAAGNQLP